MERDILRLHAGWNGRILKTRRLAWGPYFDFALLEPCRRIHRLERSVREQWEVIFGFNNFRSGLEGRFDIASIGSSAASGGRIAGACGCQLLCLSQIAFATLCRHWTF